MSDENGKAASAKGQQEVNVKLTGKLKKAQWSEVTEKLRALGKSLNVEVTVKAPSKKAPGKKAPKKKAPKK